MRLADLLRFARDAATGSLTRTVLLVLAMTIGVAAVVVLTALGDGARRYVVNEFSALGTNLVIVLPGRSETRGFNPANAITDTPRDLTIADAQALLRNPAVKRAAPITVGTSEISANGKLREVMVAGITASYFDVRGIRVGQGQRFPDDDWNRAAPYAILGANVRTDVFGNAPAVGQLARIGDRRFRIIGVMAPSGTGMGLNIDEVVLVPVAAAQAMFNSNSLFRILVEARNRDGIPQVKDQVLKTIIARHDGEEDVTVITQDAVLATFDRLLGTLTLGVAGIAA
ncbi:MAG TPA: ABC transporter permease, partial [Rhodocyclaceae bacterium]|nr:ABC transporter permease [Rhodocyclaceae bacterium]